MHLYFSWFNIYDHDILYVWICFVVFYMGTPVVQLQNMKDVTEDVGLGTSGKRVKSQCPKDPCKKLKVKTEK